MKTRQTASGRVTYPIELVPPLRSDRFAARHPGKRRGLERIGAVAGQRLHREHDRPGNRELASTAGEEEASADQNEMHGADHERQRVKARPARIDSRNDQKCANHFRGYGIPGNEPVITVDGEVVPPLVKAARIEKELQINMRPEERAEGKAKEEDTVWPGALIEHLFLQKYAAYAGRRRSAAGLLGT